MACTIMQLFAFACVCLFVCSLYNCTPLIVTPGLIVCYSDQRTVSLSLQPYTHTCTRTVSHTHTHLHTHTYSHYLVLFEFLTKMYLHLGYRLIIAPCSHNFIHVHTLTHAYTHLHTPTHVYTHLHTPTHAYTRLHTPTHTYTHLHTPTHTYSRLHTPTHAYTHLHTPCKTIISEYGSPAIGRLMHGLYYVHK